MSAHTPPSTSPWRHVALIALTGTVILLGSLGGAALGIGTAERDYWFAPSDEAWPQSLLPALETPYAAPWSPSSAAGRAAMGIARGRRSALRDLSAVAAAAAITALGLCLFAAGIPLAAVVGAMAGGAAGSSFWWRSVYWTPDAVSPLLAVFAIWAGWQWLVTRRPALYAGALTAAMLATAENPAWLVCIPAAVVFSWRHVTSRTDRALATAAGVLVAAAALWPFATHAAVAGRAAWPSIAAVDPPALSRWAPVIDASLPSAATLGANLAKEFTPLGAGLLVIGSAVLWGSRRHRAGLALLVAGCLGWQWWVPHASFESVNLPLAIGGWATVAVALRWILHTLHARSGQVVLALIAVLIAGEPTLTRGRLSSLDANRRSDAMAEMAYRFNLATLPAGANLVAESRRVDSALWLSTQRAAKPIPIVPQRLDLLERSLERGETLVAFANARANLAPFGFLFERVDAGAMEAVALAGRASCVGLAAGTWADVSLLLASGSFVVHGTEPGSAPGGVVVRLPGSPPARFAKIEPRSIPYSLEAADTGSTLHIPATGRRTPVIFTFASVPQNAVATAETNAAVTLCPGPQSDALTLGRNPATLASLAMPSSAFGPGWHDAEADPDPFRWTSAARSSVRITLAEAGTIRVTVTATPAAPSATGPAIAFAVNACEFPRQPMPPGQGDYQWLVPATCWRSGANQLWIEVTPLVSPATLSGSPDLRQLGARVGALRLARVPADQNAK